MPPYIDVFVSPVRDSSQIQAALVAFMFLVVMDVVFGVVNACIKKEFSSTVLRKGLVHKMSEFGIIAIAVIIDGLLFAGLDIGFSSPIMAFALIAMIVMEIGSIMELLAAMNPDLANNKAFKLLASVKEPEPPAVNEGDED